MRELDVQRQLRQAVRIIRGRPVAQHRGTLLHSRPAALMLSAWAVLALWRHTVGPIAPAGAFIGLTAPLGLLPLCLQPAERPATQPQPSLLTTLARFVILFVAMCALQLAWHWLAHPHE